MALSKKKAYRHSCAGFDVDDAKRWWARKGPGHAARMREARGATWKRSGSGRDPYEGYVTMTRAAHKYDTVHEERDTTIMCSNGRITAFAGRYRRGM